VVDKNQKKSFIPNESEFRDLVDRANYGDGEARSELKRILDHTPELWRAAGDINQHIQDDLIRQLAKSDFLLEESTRRRLAEQRQRLQQNPDSLVEQLCVERVLACELELWALASRYPDVAKLSSDRAAEVLRSKESAEKRLRTAMKSLAAVQKFKLRKQ